VASSGFAVAISATDNASKTLDSVNKRLAALSAPAERFNKALTKFGDVSGISRVAEGVQSLGRSSLAAFQSLDRMGGPLAAITSAASIGGIVELTRRWADLGTKILQTGIALNVPTDKLTAWQGAATAAGSDAATLNAALGGLRDTLSDAAWGRNAEAMNALRDIGIDSGAPGHVADTLATMLKISDVIHRMPDPHTKLMEMSRLGIPANFLPMLDLGSAGIQKLLDKMQALGAVVTPGMAARANEAREAFADLGAALGGVANRLSDDLMPAFGRWAEAGALLIGKNKEIVQSFAEIGAGITALALLKPAWWVLKLLGLPGQAAIPVTALATIYELNKAGQDKFAADAKDRGFEPTPTSFFNPIPSFVNPQTGERLTYGQMRERMGGAPAEAPGLVERLIRQFAPTPHMSSVDTTMNPVRRGFLDTIAGPESGGRYDIKNGGSTFRDYSKFPEGIGPGGTSTAAGRYQFISGTWRSVASAAGLNDFSPENQDKGAWHLASTAYHAKTSGDLETDLRAGGNDMKIAGALGPIWPSLPGGSQSHQSLDDFHRSLTTNIAGEVAVNVTLRGAPPGTTATATTSGPVSAPPPRIEPMPFLN
jgi:muramidase (phage lysozyme)